MGIPLVSRDRFELADGRRIVRDVGIVFMKLGGAVGATRIMFGARRDAPVLGNIALEELSLERSEVGYLRKAGRLFVSAHRPAVAA